MEGKKKVIINERVTVYATSAFMKNKDAATLKPGKELKIHPILADRLEKEGRVTRKQPKSE